MVFSPNKSCSAWADTCNQMCMASEPASDLGLDTAHTNRPCMSGNALFRVCIGVLACACVCVYVRV